MRPFWWVKIFQKWLHQIDQNSEEKEEEELPSIQEENHLFFGGIPRIKPLSRDATTGLCTFQVLLGQRYHSSYPHAFDTFLETLHHIRHRTPTVFDAFHQLCDQGKILKGIVPEKITLLAINDYFHPQQEKKKKTYHVIITLLYRISVAYHLGDATTIPLNLQLFVDEHLPLCAYLLRHPHRYEDRDLMFVHRNSESLCESALVQWCPRVYDEKTDLPWIAYGGFLPDLTSCLELGDLWYGSRTQQVNLLRSVVHLFVTKMQPHKCTNRNFAPILKRYGARYPVLIRLFRLIIELGLLGNYPTAKKRPAFDTRVLIHESLRGSIGAPLLGNKAFIHWVLTNEKLCYFISREMCAYMIDRDISIRVVLEEETQWERMIGLVREANDYWRARLLPILCGDEAARDEMIRQLQLYHNQALRCNTKLMKGHFEDIILGFMDKLRAATPPQQSDLNRMNYQDADGNLEYLIRRVVTREVLDRQMVLHCWQIDRDDYRRSHLECPIVDDDDDPWIVSLRKIAAETEASPWVPLPGPYVIRIHWMKMMGITSEGYRLLKRLLFRYESRLLTDKRINELLLAIRRGSERDFNLLYLYLCRIAQYQTIMRHFRLEERTAKAQEYTLRLKMRLMPWQKLSPYYSHPVFCSICHHWSLAEVRLVDPRTWVDIYAMGMSYVAYHPKEQRIFCDKQVTITSNGNGEKKRKRKGKKKDGGSGGYDDEEDDDEDDEEDDAPIDENDPVARAQRDLRLMKRLNREITDTTQGAIVGGGGDAMPPLMKTRAPATAAIYSRKKRRHVSNRGVSTSNADVALTKLLSPNVPVELSEGKHAGSANNGHARKQRHSNSNLKMITYKMVTRGGRENTLLLSRKPWLAETGRGQLLNCHETPMVHAEILGHEHCLGGKRWVLCEICGCITPLENYCLDPEGRITCGIHMAVRDVPPVDTIDHALMRLAPTAPIECMACGKHFMSSFTAAPSSSSGVVGEDDIIGDAFDEEDAQKKLHSYHSKFELVEIIEDVFFKTLKPGDFRRTPFWLCSEDYGALLTSNLFDIQNGPLMSRVLRVLHYKFMRKHMITTSTSAGWAKPASATAAAANAASAIAAASHHHRR